MTTTTNPWLRRLAWSANSTSTPPHCGMFEKLLLGAHLPIARRVRRPLAELHRPCRPAALSARLCSGRSRDRPTDRPSERPDRPPGRKARPTARPLDRPAARPSARPACAR